MKKSDGTESHNALVCELVILCYTFHAIIIVYEHRLKTSRKE